MILRVFLSILFPFLYLQVKGSKHKENNDIILKRGSEFWDLTQTLES